MKRLSASTVKNGDKGYYQGFEPIEVKTLRGLGKLMLTHSLSSQLYGADNTATSSGHMVPYRKAIDNITGHGQVVFFDIDNKQKLKDETGKTVMERCDPDPVTLEKIVAKFEEHGWGCVITPSRSSKPEWPKFHIGCFTEEEVSDHYEFANQYLTLESMLRGLHVDLVMRSSVQNLTPAPGRKILAVVKGNDIPMHELNYEDLDDAYYTAKSKATAGYDAAVHNLHLENGGESLSADAMIDEAEAAGVGKTVRCGCHNNNDHGKNDSGAICQLNDNGSVHYWCAGCDETVWLRSEKRGNTLDGEVITADDIIRNIDEMIADESVSNGDIIAEIAKVGSALDQEGYIAHMKKKRGVSVSAVRADLANAAKAEMKKSVTVSFPHTQENWPFAPLSTIDNMEVLFNKLLKLKYFYDVVRKEVHVDGWSGENNWKTKFRSHVISSVEVLNLPRTVMEDHFGTMLRSKDRNPLLEAVQGGEWDGKDHIGDLMKRIKSDTGTAAYRRDILTRWLIQCVAAWDGAETTPRKDAIAKYELLFVLGGAQGVLKTTFFTHLMTGAMRPYLATGALLRTDNRDSIKQLTSYGIVELGELEATFKKSDIEDLKAFTSREHDEYRVSYGKDDERHKRHTSFCASVNTTEFLKDHTGSRRFAYIKLLGQVSLEGVNIEQMWKQVWHLYSVKGERWWLLPEDKSMKIQAEVNMTATDSGIVGDAVIKLKALLREKDGREKHVRVSATQIWQELMGNNPKVAERSIFYSEIERLSKEEEFKELHITCSKKNGVSIPGGMTVVYDA